MKHIIFNEPDVAVIQAAMGLDETLVGDIVFIKDDYAVGPLTDIYTGVGKEVRLQWWAGMHQLLEINMNGDVDDAGTIANLVGEMRRNEEEIIWLWVAQNKHDVSGYYWTLKYMQEFQGRVFILYLNNLPFLTEEGALFYPKWISEIPAKEFLKAKKLARPITLSEFEIDPDEWYRLCKEGKLVRILEGGKKLEQYDADYYDEALGSYVSGDWQKLQKIVNSFLQKEKETTGDTFLYWRLMLLLNNANWELRNEGKGMRNLEIKNPEIASTRKSKKVEDANS